VGVTIWSVCVVNVCLIFKFPSSYLRFSSSSTTYVHPKRGGPVRPVQNTCTGTEGFNTPPPSAGCSSTDSVRTTMCFPHSVGHKKPPKDTFDDDRGWDPNMSLSDGTRCLSLSYRLSLGSPHQVGLGSPFFPTGCTLCVHGVYVFYKVSAVLY
jgi:hypothetical protein